ncbi:Sec23-binding domain of Sec16-domain-containing protein [Gaertneriomyces semiglobifer]|nr:Sec23-binding domain of Sec16-domain-containing protein [Gaertneriomyces semiglobifer]
MATTATGQNTRSRQHSFQSSKDAASDASFFDAFGIPSDPLPTPPAARKTSKLFDAFDVSTFPPSATVKPATNQNLKSQPPPQSQSQSQSQSQPQPQPRTQHQPQPVNTSDFSWTDPNTGLAYDFSGGFLHLSAEDDNQQKESDAVAQPVSNVQSSIASVKPNVDTNHNTNHDTISFGTSEDVFPTSSVVSNQPVAFPTRSAVEDDTIQFANAAVVTTDPFDFANGSDAAKNQFLPQAAPEVHAGVEQPEQTLKRLDSSASVEQKAPKAESAPQMESVRESKEQWLPSPPNELVNGTSDAADHESSRQHAYDAIPNIINGNELAQASTGQKAEQTAPEIDFMTQHPVTLPQEQQDPFFGQGQTHDLPWFQTKDKQWDDPFASFTNNVVESQPQPQGIPIAERPAPLVDESASDPVEAQQPQQQTELQWYQGANSQWDHNFSSDAHALNGEHPSAFSEKEREEPPQPQRQQTVEMIQPPETGDSVEGTVTAANQAQEPQWYQAEDGQWYQYYPSVDGAGAEQSQIPTEPETKSATGANQQPEQSSAPQEAASAHATVHAGEPQWYQGEDGQWYQYYPTAPIVNTDQAHVVDEKHSTPLAQESQSQEHAVHEQASTQQQEPSGSELQWYQGEDGQWYQYYPTNGAFNDAQQPLEASSTPQETEQLPPSQQEQEMEEIKEPVAPALEKRNGQSAGARIQDESSNHDTINFSASSNDPFAFSSFAHAESTSLPQSHQSDVAPVSEHTHEAENGTAIVDSTPEAQWYRAEDGQWYQYYPTYDSTSNQTYQGVDPALERSEQASANESVEAAPTFPGHGYASQSHEMEEVQEHQGGDVVGASTYTGFSSVSAPGQAEKVPPPPSVAGSHHSESVPPPPPSHGSSYYAQTTVPPPPSHSGSYQSQAALNGELSRTDEYSRSMDTGSMPLSNAQSYQETNFAPNTVPAVESGHAWSYSNDAVLNHTSDVRPENSASYQAQAAIPQPARTESYQAQASYGDTQRYGLPATKDLQLSAFTSRSSVSSLSSNRDHVCCDRCGRRNDSDANFCGKCGNNLAAAVAAAVAVSADSADANARPPVAPLTGGTTSTSSFAVPAGYSRPPSVPPSFSAHGPSPSPSAGTPNGENMYRSNKIPRRAVTPGVRTDSYYSSYKGTIPASAGSQYGGQPEQEHYIPPAAVADPAAFVDPLGRHRGHCVAMLGPNGKLMVSAPKRQTRYVTDMQGRPSMVEKCYPGELCMVSVRQVLKPDVLARYTPTSPSGPLIGKTKYKKKDVVKLCADLIAAADRKREASLLEMDSMARSGSVTDVDQWHIEECADHLLLVKLLKIFVEADGILIGAKSDGSVNRTVLDLLEIKEPRQAGVVGQIEASLLKGDREPACQAAASKGLWGHALVIASNISQGAYQDVVSKFNRAELTASAVVSHSDTGMKEDRPGLRTLYALFSGAGPNAISEFLPDPTVDPVSPMSEYLSEWKSILRLILMNRTPGDLHAIALLGDRLSQYGKRHAGQFCHLLAGLPNTVSGLAPASQNTRIVLIGADHARHPTTFFQSIEALRYTEVYEYAMTSANGLGNALPHLQAYKILYAALLADMGLFEEAAKYGESVETVVKAYARGSPYFHRAFGDVLTVVLERMRLGAAGANGVTTGKEGGGWLSKLGSLGARGLDKFMNNAIGDTVSGTATAGQTPASAPVGASSFESPAFGGHYQTSLSASPAKSAVEQDGYGHPPAAPYFGQPAANDNVGFQQHQYENQTFNAGYDMQTQQWNGHSNQDYGYQHHQVQQEPYANASYEQAPHNVSQVAPSEHQPTPQHEYGYPHQQPQEAYSANYHHDVSQMSIPEHSGQQQQQYGHPQDTSHYGQPGADDQYQHDQAQGPDYGADEMAAYGQSTGGHAQGDYGYGGYDSQTQQPQEYGNQSQHQQQYGYDDAGNGYAYHGEPTGGNYVGWNGSSQDVEGTGLPDQQHYGYADQRDNGDIPQEAAGYAGWNGSTENVGSQEVVEEDLGFGNKSTKNEAVAPPPTTATPAVEEAKAPATTVNEQSETDTKQEGEKEKDKTSPKPEGKSGGLFSAIGSLFGSRKKGSDESLNDSSSTNGPVKANLGEKNAFYYDKEKKRWVNRNADPSEEAKKDVLPPPPPMTASGPVSRMGTPAAMGNALPALSEARSDSPAVESPTGSVASMRAGARRGARNRYVDVFNDGKKTPDNATTLKSFLPPPGPTLASTEGMGILKPAMNTVTPQSFYDTYAETDTDQRAENQQAPQSRTSYAVNAGSGGQRPNIPTGRPPSASPLHHQQHPHPPVPRPVSQPNGTRPPSRTQHQVPHQSQMHPHRPQSQPQQPYAPQYGSPVADRRGGAGGSSYMDARRRGSAGSPRINGRTGMGTPKQGAPPADF